MPIEKRRNEEGGEEISLATRYIAMARTIRINQIRMRILGYREIFLYNVVEKDEVARIASKGKKIHVYLGRLVVEKRNIAA